MPHSRTGFPGAGADARPGPLAGLRVLELGERVAAPYCAKLLGDLGADVIKVERPGAGDPARRRGPFRGDRVDPEQSALFLHLNTSKRGVTLDLDREADRAAFRRLAAWADVLVEDRPPGELEAKGLGYAALSRDNPRLVVTSVTPFGQTGPNAGHRSYHLNLYHGAGHTSPFRPASLLESRAASKAGGQLGECDAGLTAALGTLAAVIARRDTGRGQHVDVSKQEAMMCLERVTIGRFANERDPFAGRSGPGGPIRAKDGWFIVTTLESHQWKGLVEAMGDPAWSREPWCQDPEGRMRHQEEVQRYVGAWASERTREEIHHALQARGTPAGPVRDVAEVMAWPQIRARGFFRELLHPKAGTLAYPTGPYRFSEAEWVGSAAPTLGAHDPGILGEPGPAAGAPGVGRELPRATASETGRGRGPLAGVRILDFTWAWAGPHGSLLLGMLGAEVIKVESRARLDHARVHSLTAGSFAGRYDESPVFQELNLGKKSVTLNLRTEGGRDLVRRLVPHCEVVLQNMRPGVLDRMGLGYEDLRRVREDLVMLSSSAVGATGPERTYAGYAPTFACLSGVASISGHPDDPPLPLSGSVDLRVGTAAAFAVLAALLHKARTGQGQHIDLSSTEVMSSMIGEAFLGYQLSGRVPGRIGNRDEWMAPHGCYRCRPAGRPEREWVSIAVDDEEEWQAFRAVVGDPELAREAFATREARLRNQDALDAVVERFTSRHAPAEVVERLQRAGVAAAIVHTGASLAEDPHLRARGVYEIVEHPLLGVLKSLRPPWRLEGAELPGPSPLLGQHNDYVLGEILGLGKDEIADLVAAEVVY